MCVPEIKLATFIFAIFYILAHFYLLIYHEEKDIKIPHKVGIVHFSLKFYQFLFSMAWCL